MRPLAIDLFCGLGGWTEGLIDAGYDVIGFDLERHEYGEHRYPATLVIQDVTTLHGSQFRTAALIVASPPCQGYSYRAMPWSRARALPPPDNTLFEACFRIQREACEAAGRHIPLIVENVRGAQRWVGRARWNYGSFYLWGDVPALMPFAHKAVKAPWHGLERSNTTRPVVRGQRYQVRRRLVCDQGSETRSNGCGKRWQAESCRSHDRQNTAGAVALHRRNLQAWSITMRRNWMPLYIPDFLADTVHLTAAETGAYLCLIMDYWLHDGLPDDDHKLAAITRLPIRSWRQMRPTIQAFFYGADGAGFAWRHKRIDAELVRMTGVMERRRAAGSKGGIASTMARWNGKPAPGKYQASAQANVEQTGEQTAKQNPSGAQAKVNHTTKKDIINTTSEAARDPAPQQESGSATKPAEKPPIPTTGSLAEVIAAKGWAP